MQRLLSTALVFGLLVATAAAFAVTESLKLTKSPIANARIVSPARVGEPHPPILKAFSPVCRCRSNEATLQFRLLKPDTATVDVLRGGRSTVRRLVQPTGVHKGWNSVTWNGRTDEQVVAPDGSYQFRVKLAKARRTYVLPNRVELDTTAPRVLEASASRPVFSPDGDHQADTVRISARLTERARLVGFALGRQVLLTRFAHRVNSFTWPGTAHGAGLPQGTYRFRVAAIDPAGNVTPAAGRAVVLVRIRYIRLAHAALRVKVGTRFGIGVDTDAVSYDWRLGAASGSSSTDVLVVRAPGRRGTYRLVVTENGHRAAATVVVVPRR